MPSPTGEPKAKAKAKEKEEAALVGGKSEHAFEEEEDATGEASQGVSRGEGPHEPGLAGALMEVVTQGVDRH